MALHNLDLQKMQALMMIQMKVRGMGNQEIANELNLSRNTVERRLAFANKAKLFVTFEQQILDELIPAAMKAIKTALDDGDSETALELFKGMGILKDPKAPKTQAEAADQDELQNYIAKAREAQTLDANTIDATTIDDPLSNLAGLISDGSDETVEGESSPVLVGEPTGEGAPVDQKV